MGSSFVGATSGAMPNLAYTEVYTRNRHADGLNLLSVYGACSYVSGLYVLDFFFSLELSLILSDPICEILVMHLAVLVGQALFARRTRTAICRLKLVT